MLIFRLLKLKITKNSIEDKLKYVASIFNKNFIILDDESAVTCKYHRTLECTISHAKYCDVYTYATRKHECAESENVIVKSV